MLTEVSFDHAVLRVVPRVERQEFPRIIASLTKLRWQKLRWQTE